MEAFAEEKEPGWQAGDWAWNPVTLKAQPNSDGSWGQEDDAAGNNASAPVGVPPLHNMAPAAQTAPGPSQQKAACKLLKGPLNCQVEGCGKDLTVEKSYYQRYRVCESHLKMLSLMVDGKPSRFCQQCGRFHELHEFDGNKRSCRARLAQHNARRRKRHPFGRSDTFGEQLTTKKGRAPKSESSDEASGRTSLDMGSGDHKAHGKGNRLGKQNSVALPAQQDQQEFQGMLGKGSDQLLVPQMLGNAGTTGINLGALGLDGMGLQDFNAQQLLGAGAGPSVGPIMHSLQLGDAAAAGALAMGGITLGSLQLGDLVNPVNMSSAQQLSSMGLDLRSGTLMGSGLGGQDRGAGGSLPVLSAGPGGNTLVLGSAGQGMSMGFNLDGSLKQGGATLQPLQLLGGMGGGASQQVGGQGGRAQTLNLGAAATLGGGLNLSSFGSGVGGSGPGSGSSGATGLGNKGLTGPSLAASLLQGGSNRAYVPENKAGMAPGTSAGINLGPAPQQQLRTGVSMGMGPGTVVNLGQAFSAAPAGAFLGGMGGATDTVLPAALQGLTQDAAQQMSSFDLARMLVAGGGAAQQYRSEDVMVRVSLKIANCTPDQLPPDMYERLRVLLASADASLVQGFLRPGCAHLVLDVRAPAPRPSAAPLRRAVSSSWGSGLGSWSSADDDEEAEEEEEPVPSLHRARSCMEWSLQEEEVVDPLPGITAEQLAEAVLGPQLLMQSRHTVIVQKNSHVTVVHMGRALHNAHASLTAADAVAASSVPSARAVAPVAAGAGAAAASSPGSYTARATTAPVHDGVPQRRESLRCSSAATAGQPSLVAVSPAAVFEPATGQAVVYAVGCGLSQPPVSLLLRQQGGYLKVTSCEQLSAAQAEAEAPAQARIAAAGASSGGSHLRGLHGQQSGREQEALHVYRLQVSGVRRAGLAVLEAQQGLLLGNWLPLLLLPTTHAAAAAQLCAQQQQLGSAGVAAAVACALTVDVGRVLDYTQALHLYEQPLSQQEQRAWGQGHAAAIGAAAALQQEQQPLKHMASRAAQRALAFCAAQPHMGAVCALLAGLGLTGPEPTTAGALAAGPSAAAFASAAGAQEVSGAASPAVTASAVAVAPMLVAASVCQWLQLAAAAVSTAAAVAVTAGAHYGAPQGQCRGPVRASARAAPVSMHVACAPLPMACT